MPASGIKLLDANVWLAAAFSDHQHHPAARRWFDSQPDGACAFCRITQLALLRHLTNTKIMGKFVQSQRNAWLSFSQLARDARVIFLAEPIGIETSLRNFTDAESPAHERWTDAYLAAFALHTPAQFVTFDRGFTHFSGLDVLVLD